MNSSLWLSSFENDFKSNFKMKFLIFKFLVLLLSFNINLVSAEELADETEIEGSSFEVIVDACDSIMDDYTFGINASTTKIYYKELCLYPPTSGSILNCIANKFGAYSGTFNKAIDNIVSLCNNDYASLNVTKDEILAIYENATKHVVDISSLTNVNLTTYIFYQPVNITPSMIEEIYKYERTFYYNMDMPIVFSGIQYCFFLFIFLIYAIGNFINRIGVHRKLNNRVINWYRANVSVPALFNGRHTEPPVYLKVFSTLLPTRIESIIVLLFLGLNILLICVHYDFTSKEALRFRQLDRMVGYRTGILAIGHVPLIILLAGRNNVVTSITGIPYASLIVYHKLVARMMTLCALIHACCFTDLYRRGGYLAETYTAKYMRWGAVAMVLACLICFQAIHTFRKVMYETFVVIHIVFVVLFIVGCFYHLQELGSLEWCYASWACWIFDRMIKAIRMLAFGFRKAEIQLMSDDTLKIKVKHNALYRPFPGAFSYVYFVHPLMFWQSHPFTVIDSVITPNEIRFHVKTKKGITKKINKILSKLPENKKQMLVTVEGPYGYRAPLEKYDSVILLAGGHGIPGPFSHALDLSKRGTSNRQHVKLYWTIKDPEALWWFYEELLVLAKTGSTEIHISITGAPADNITALNGKDELALDVNDPSTESEPPSFRDAGTEEAEKEKSSPKSPEQKEPLSVERLNNDYRAIIRLLSGFNVYFYSSRPNIQDIIHSEFTAGENSVAVMTCGAPKMCDEARYYVAKYLQESKGRVDLFEEFQQW